jgi:hypothetical protein
MRLRILLLAGLALVAGLVLLSCSMGRGNLARVTATSTKTARPLVTATLTPTIALPTDTPQPTATPLPPTATPIPPTATPTLPTDTPPPADTPIPPSDTPPPTAPPPTETPVPAPTQPPAPQPAASATRPRPTATAKPKVDFVIKEIVAFEDGSLTKTGFHNIYFTVLDAGGAPLDGIILQEVDHQPPAQVISGDKGPGKAEFTMYAEDYRFKVVGNTGGQSFSSETTHPLTIAFGHAIYDDLIRGGICANEAACRALGPMHYSYNVTFQRTW